MHIYCVMIFWQTFVGMVNDELFQQARGKIKTNEWEIPTDFPSPSSTLFMATSYLLIHFTGFYNNVLLFFGIGDIWPFYLLGIYDGYSAWPSLVDWCNEYWRTSLLHASLIGGSVFLIFIQATQPSSLHAILIGDDFSHCWGRNSEFCVAVGPVSSFAGIMANKPIC